MPSFGRPPPPAARKFPGWTGAELKRPGALLAAASALLFSAPVSFIVSCQMHEIGHALVGTAFGWRVEQIHWCLPTGGSVHYASTSGGYWADVAESFAGGIAGALFLLTVYVLVFVLPRAPLRRPGWWGAGFGPVLWVGPQLVISLAEGSIRDRDYAQVLDANLAASLSLLGVTMAAGAAVHIWLWRSVWNRKHREGPRSEGSP